ncbi:MAG: hypothetical protein RLZZ126_388 [Pseudomonadota bacterium]|jgi:cytochrome P450
MAHPNRFRPLTTAEMLPARASSMAQTLDLRDLPDDFYVNPYPVYAHLREHSPVRQLPDGSWLLTRHADLVAVYRDAATFSSDKKLEFGAKYNRAPFATATMLAPLFEHHTTSLVFNDPPLHSRVRKLIMGALSRRAIDQMEAGLVQLVNGLLDRIAVQGGGDLIEDFASAIPVEVIGNLLGVPHAERGPLREWSLAILGALEPALTPAQEQRGNAAVTEFTRYLQSLVAKRRAQPGDPAQDVLTRLIQGEGADPSGQLSEAELLQNCVFILNAGHETTTNLIGNALVALQEWPDQLDRLLYKQKQYFQYQQRNFDDFSPEIDEFLRFESSNQLGNRRAVKDCVVGGVHLPAGSLLTLCIGAANRDPAVFDAPDELRLDRPSNRHLAFGFGIHQCAGLSLARLEGAIAVSSFLQRFPRYRLTQAPTRGRRVRFRGFLRAPFEP